MGWMHPTFVVPPMPEQEQPLTPHSFRSLATTPYCLQETLRQGQSSVSSRFDQPLRRPREQSAAVSRSLATPQPPRRRDKVEMRWSSPREPYRLIHPTR